MNLQLFDTLTIDDAANVRYTTDGYLVAQPRVARTGIQLYSGSEIGKPDVKIVRVFRPEAEVFHSDSLRSYAHRPLTNDHPPVPVTSENWKDFSTGQTGEDVVRDGEFVRVPMVMMDEEAINDFRDGKRELSLGYTCDLAWTPGTAPNGEQYDAVQTNIRANHLAVVKAARGGASLRIGDAQMYWDKDYTAKERGEMARTGEAMPNGGYPIKTKADLENAIQAYGRNPTPAVKTHIKKRAKALGAEKMLPENWNDAADADAVALRDRVGYNGESKMSVRNIMVGDVSLEVSDIAASVINGHLNRMSKTIESLQGKLDEAEGKTKKAEQDAATIATENKTKLDAAMAENATLKKQLEDAAMTPAKIDALVVDRAGVIAGAKKVLADKLVIDNKTNADIRRQVVDHVMKDAAKGWSDDAVTASFNTIVASVKDSASPGAGGGTVHRPGFNGGGTSFQDLRASFSFQQDHQNLSDSDKAYGEMTKDLGNAWKGDAKH